MTDETDFWNLIATGREAVLSTINRSGLPQLSNVLYLPATDGRAVRISTTADRLKARNLTRDPRAVLHVAGDNFWAYAVAEGHGGLAAPIYGSDGEICGAFSIAGVATRLEDHLDTLAPLTIEGAEEISRLIGGPTPDRTTPSKELG